MFIVLLFPFLFSWHYSPCAADVVSLSPSRVSQSTIKVSVLWFSMRTHSKALEWVKQAWQYLGVLSRPYCSQIKHRRVIPFSCNFESNNIDVIIYGMAVYGNAHKKDTMQYAASIVRRVYSPRLHSITPLSMIPLLFAASFPPSSSCPSVTQTSSSVHHRCRR